MVNSNFILHLSKLIDESSLIALAFFFNFNFLKIQQPNI